MTRYTGPWFDLRQGLGQGVLGYLPVVVRLQAEPETLRHAEEPRSFASRPIFSNSLTYQLYLRFRGSVGFNVLSNNRVSAGDEQLPPPRSFLLSSDRSR